MFDRVFRLMEHHQKLDTQLQLARLRRWPDPFEIAQLKKLKLAIKDRMARKLQEHNARFGRSLTGGQ